MSKYQGKYISVSKTQRVLNMACALDALDIALLPGVFRALEIHLNITPVDLGYLALIQALMSKIFTPIWGIVSEIYPDRMKILGTACFFWGLFTIGIGCSSTFYQLCFFRAFNGIALAVINPLSQSIISDLFDGEQRGKAFGWVSYSTGMGQLIGGLYAATISNQLLLNGQLLGWRVPFLTVGLFSVLFSFYIILYIKEPTRNFSDHTRTHQNIEGPLAEARKISRWALEELFRVKSLRIVVIQGLFGAIPWNAFVFIIFWLQYIGFTDAQAAIIRSIMILGTSVGSLFGGYLGDFAEKRSLYHGRAYVAQCTVLSGIPMVYLIFHVVPLSIDYGSDGYADDAAFLTMSFLFFLFGFVICWSSTAVNRPLFAELVSPKTRGFAFSIMIAFEGSTAAIFGAPLVGYLSENYFDYKSSNVPVIDMNSLEKTFNANALSDSILCISLVGWGICFLFYCMLHVYYPADKRRLIQSKSQA